MSSSAFDRMQTELKQHGIDGALTYLARQLRTEKRYHELFEALKLQLRRRLGLPLLVDQDATDELGQTLDEQFEQGLLAACHDVGMALMGEGRIREGWMYLRPVGNRSEVMGLLSELNVAEDQVDEVIEVALHEGVAPPLGFRLILDRYGTCNAITTFEAQLPGLGVGAREAIASMLVRHVYDELTSSVRVHIERQEKAPASANELRELLMKRPWLTAAGSHHVDASHLASAVRFGRLARDPQTIDLALQMTEYGQLLDEALRYPGEEPFVDNFLAHHHYFEALLGRQVESALDYFQQRAAAVDAHQQGTSAAEVFIELLSRCGRSNEAIDASIRYIPPGTHTRGIAPSLLELSRQAGHFEPWRDFCRQQGDLLGFTTALLHTVADDGSAESHA